MAVLHHNDAVCRQGLVHEVRDVHQRGTGRGKAAHDAHDCRAAADIQERGRLVQHQHGRFHGQGARNADALTLAAGKARGVRVGVLLHGNAPQLAGYADGNLGAGDAQVLRAKGNVVGNHAGYDLVIRVLEDQAQLTAGVPVGREVGHAARADRVTGKLDVSLVGGQKPADDGGQR